MIGPRGGIGSTLPPWQPWLTLALFAFLLNFIREMVQAPFYLGHATLPYRVMVGGCARATLGDIGILLLSYSVVAGVRGRLWLVHRAVGPIVAYMGLGVAATIVIEGVSVNLLARWTYAPAMPTVAGIGMLPVLQWVVLPPSVLWLARRHLLGAPAL